MARLKAGRWSTTGPRPRRSGNPLRRRAEEERRVATERRAVSVEVRIGSELRYVTKEMAETLELLLRDHDELGICKAFTGGVVF